MRWPDAARPDPGGLLPLHPFFMNRITHRFSDPDTLIDRVHTLFERWEADGTFEPLLDATTLQRLKLAVHEWLANLLQHANFQERIPEVEFSLHLDGQSVHCCIDDNSEGFDLDGHLSARREVLDAFPERGMGLLMIKSCTEHLAHRQIDDARHRLEFSVSADQDPWLNIPF